MTDAPLDYEAPMPALLKAWRAKLRLTQAQAALRLRVPLHTLQGWEHGKQPSPDGPLRIAMQALERAA